MVKFLGVVLFSTFPAFAVVADSVPATPVGNVQCNVIEWNLKEGKDLDPKELSRTCPLFHEGKFGIVGVCDFIGLGLEVHVEVIGGKVDLITVTKGKITVESESETVKLYDARTHHQYLVGCTVRTR